MSEIQARTGEIPTLDDALKEMLENYKKKVRKRYQTSFRIEFDFYL
jgi:hypothetical protein